MLSHYPRFRHGAEPGLVHKLGGLPWGLPSQMWPICEECARPMSHLGQFPARSADAHAPALALPEDGVLFLFKCEWDSVCSFWESDGGANRALCLPRSALGDAPTPAPAHGEDGPPATLPELGVAHWHVQDDGAPAELESAFYDYMAYDDLPSEVTHPDNWREGWRRTKMGGVPYWTPNGATGQPGIPPGRLLLQIDNWVPMQDGGNEEVANFCSDGTAFVFIDPAQRPPVLAMIINR